MTGKAAFDVAGAFFGVFNLFVETSNGSAEAFEAVR